jgi:hypothetical protein
MDLHSSINYYWKFPLRLNKDKIQSSQRPKRNGERPLENQEHQKDRINSLQWKNELIKDSLHIV